MYSNGSCCIDHNELCITCGQPAKAGDRSFGPGLSYAQDFNVAPTHFYFADPLFLRSFNRPVLHRQILLAGSKMYSNGSCCIDHNELCITCGQPAKAGDR
jgi:hypothetical protein